MPSRHSAARDPNAFATESELKPLTGGYSLIYFIYRYSTV
jgi:hypothetical protein